MANLQKMKLDIFDEITSTNDYCKNLWNQQPNLDNYGCMALYQTKGRGQQDKVWQGNKNQNIYLSVLIKINLLNKSAFSIIMAAAIIVRDFLSTICPSHEFLIKYPNDIYVQGKKIGGILIENKIVEGVIQHTIIGMGININQTQFPNNINATSLKQLVNANFDIYVLTQQLFENMCKHIKLFIHSKNLLQEYNNQLFKLSEKLSVVANEKKFEGFFWGIEKDGTILLKQNNEIIRVAPPVQWLF